FAGDDPDLVADLMMAAGAESYSILFPIAQRQAPRFLPLFQAEIARQAGDPEVSEGDKDQLAMRQARAAIALVRLGKAEEVFPLLRHSSDPRLRSFILNWLNPLGADPKVLAGELDRLDRRGSHEGVGRGSPDPAQGLDRRSPASASGVAADSGRPSVRRRGGDPSGARRPAPNSGGIASWLLFPGELIVYDGVTRATWVAKLLPGQTVPVEVIGDVPSPGARFPTVGERLP
ncbi:MAG: hypothetical protein ACHRXM_21410, partial [Isosphaerales bacterium]